MPRVDKGLEDFYLKKFKESFSEFPQGEISSDEGPDFLVKTTSGIIGIELTGFYREMSGGGHPPLQQRVKARQEILNRAKSLCDEQGLHAVHVHVHFDLSFHCKGTEIPSVARRLVQLVKRSLSEQADQKTWRRGDIQINGVILMVVHKAQRSKSYWSDPFASFVPNVNPKQIQDILGEKNTRCEDYRKKCNQVWLVIVMDRFKASSFSRIPPSTLEHVYAHLFDSAFLFVYDYSDAQKPPFLLRKS